MSNRQQLVKQQADTVRAALEKLKPQLAMALPDHLTPERLLRVTMTAVQTNPKLLDCDRTSLFASVLTCAQLGLEPDGVLGQAYLVPFKNKVQFIPGYKGYITLARNSGEIETIQAHEVCENDEFRHAYGLNEELHHRALDDDRSWGNVTHFYAYAKFKGGGHVFEVMTRAQVEAIRDNAEGYKAFKAGIIKSNPWDPEKPSSIQMGRKTLIRRLANYLPQSVQRAAALDSAYEGGKHASTDDYGDVVIEGESERVENTEGAGESRAASKLDTLAGGNEDDKDSAPEKVDKDGVPWDARIHSDSRALNKDGTWRRKRNISDEYYEKVTAELAQGDPAQDGPEEPPNDGDAKDEEKDRFSVGDDEEVIDTVTGEVVKEKYVTRFTDGRIEVSPEYFEDIGEEGGIKLFGEG